MAVAWVQREQLIRGRDDQTAAVRVQSHSPHAATEHRAVGWHVKFPHLPAGCGVDRQDRVWLAAGAVAGLLCKDHRLVFREDDAVFGMAERRDLAYQRYRID